MELFWQKVESGGQTIRPASGIPVLAVVDIGNNRRRVIRAAYAPAKTLLAHEDYQVDEAYDEETDTYWCPEGWYEENEYEDVHWGVDGTVTHWMPLPSPPDDFIGWSGGNCPVSENTMVEFKVRDGRISKSLASDLMWDHVKKESSVDIVGYRVIG